MSRPKFPQVAAFWLASFWPARSDAGVPQTSPFLAVEDLAVAFSTSDGVVRAVDGVSFSLRRGQTLGVVGESGSGKSAMSLAVLGLQTGRNTKVSGRILLDSEDLLAATKARVRDLRGSAMAMIFQDPLSALHPYYTVGWQIAEAYKAKMPATRKQAWARAVEMLGRVGIPQPAQRARDYPHQFSGGMRQRAMIAMALSCEPELLIADEPTTALDVTVQAQILELIAGLQAELKTAVILITHDLGIVAEVADETLVMYSGQVMEQGSTEQVFEAPQHPYTWGLLSSVTGLNRPRRDRLAAIPGSPPSLIAVPSGCPFHPRCPYESQTGGLAGHTRPELREASAGHWVACHLADPVRAQLYAQEVQPAL
jgi:peptide/nickel transport system ATP-binding protein